MSVAWVGAGIAAVGVVSSAVSANSAKNAQLSSARDANNLQRDEYNQTRADQQPYRDAGYSALDRMSFLLGLSGDSKAAGYGSLNKPFTGADLQSDPGYQFELNQGLKTAQNSAAARGGLYSGATLKALTQYGNDYAGTKYNEAFNRDQTEKNNEFNKYASLADKGQVATNQTDAAGQNYANNAGQNLIGAGNARGAADIAIGNSIGNGVNQGLAWWQRGQQSSGGGGGYGYSGGGVGTGAWTDTSTGTEYNNPSAYIGG